MNSVKDERVKFYMRNKELIDTWSGLVEPYRHWYREFLWSCEEEVAEVLPKLGGDAILTVVKDPKWPALSLYRPNWLEGKTRLASIDIQCETKSVSHAGGNRPYTGAHFNYGNEEGKKLREAFVARPEVVAKKTKHKYKAIPWWPAYRLIDPPPSGEFWLDLTPYRKQIADSLRQAWELFADDIEAVF